MINLYNPSQWEMIIINDYIMVNIAITIGQHQHPLHWNDHNIPSVQLSTSAAQKTLAGQLPSVSIAC